MRIQIAKTLFHDDRGALLSIEMILTATIVMIGSLVGLTAFRDAVVQEFGDVSAGMSSLDHSYKITDISYDERFDKFSSRFEIMGSGYSDTPNFCEPRVRDPANNSPMCIEITADLVIDENQRLP